GVVTAQVGDAVLGDADDPGPQAPAVALVLAVGEVADELGEGLLRHLVRVFLVEPQVPREPDDDRPVPPVELPPHGLVAGILERLEEEGRCCRSVGGGHRGSPWLGPRSRDAGRRYWHPGGGMNMHTRKSKKSALLTIPSWLKSAVRPGGHPAPKKQG